MDVFHFFIGEDASLPQIVGNWLFGDRIVNAVKLAGESISQITELKELLYIGNPQYADIWYIVKMLTDTVLIPSGIALSVGFFILHLAEMSWQTESLDRIIKMLVTEVVTIVAISRCWDVAYYVIRLGTGLVMQVDKVDVWLIRAVGLSGNVDHILDGLNSSLNAESSYFLLYIISMLFYLICMIALVVMAVAFIMRSLNIIVSTAMLPIGIADCIGLKQSTGYGYLMGYIAMVVSGAVMIIGINISGLLLRIIPYAARDTSPEIQMMIMSALQITLSGTVLYSAKKTQRWLKHE